MVKTFEGRSRVAVLIYDAVNKTELQVADKTDSELLIALAERLLDAARNHAEKAVNNRGGRGKPPLIETIVIQAK